MMDKFKALPKWKWAIVVIVVGGMLSLLWNLMSGNGA